MRKLRAAVAETRSNGVSSRPGNYAPDNSLSHAETLLAGLTVDYGYSRRKRRNTNANRKNGGPGMYFKPRTSAGYGDAPTTIPKWTS